MTGGWQISVGQLSELARPALYALSVLVSALVLADARRRLRPAASALWTLSSLVLPHVVAPLYFAARLASALTRTDARTADEREIGDVQSEDGAAEAGADSTAGHGAARPRLLARLSRLLLVPAAYAALLLAAGAVYFYYDYTGFEARLVRATDAALYGRHARAAEELRAALAARDDAHTQKLLGFQFYRAGRWEEALAAFRAAEAGGEPDDALPFHAAVTLDKLGRGDEALAEYARFLGSGRCAAQAPADRMCEVARSRASARAAGAGR